MHYCYSACVVTVMPLPLSMHVLLVIICRSWFRENWWSQLQCVSSSAVWHQLLSIPKLSTTYSASHCQLTELIAKLTLLSF